MGLRIHIRKVQDKLQSSIKEASVKKKSAQADDKKMCAGVVS